MLKIASSSFLTDVVAFLGHGRSTRSMHASHEGPDTEYLELESPTYSSLFFNLSPTNLVGAKTDDQRLTSLVYDFLFSFMLQYI